MYVEHTEYSLNTILQEVSWYWLTKSYGRSLWSYRSVWRAVLRDDNRKLPSPLAIQEKPLGYSWYPDEVLAAAKSWLEHWFPDNLVFYKAHESVRLRPFSRLSAAGLRLGLTWLNRAATLRLSIIRRVSCRTLRTLWPL